MFVDVIIYYTDKMKLFGLGFQVKDDLKYSYLKTKVCYCILKYNFAESFFEKS